MKIVVAPNSFKGTLTSTTATRIIAGTLRQRIPGADIVELPVADGGEGTLEVLLAFKGGYRIRRRVRGPLFDRKVTGEIGVSGKCAVIETASASGINLVPIGGRNPLVTTTFGTGELIAAATMIEGIREIVVGLGGSATVDGGAGALCALGVRLLDDRGDPIRPCGEELRRLRSIDTTDALPALHCKKIVVVADVANPLTGSNGAAEVFAPQKGASPEQVKILSRNLKHFADVVGETTGVDIRKIPGGGAAGGLGVALHAFFGATIVRGADYILDRIHFSWRIRGADIVITGEGKLDKSTLLGKAPLAVARRASRAGASVVVICGESSLAPRELSADEIVELNKVAGSRRKAMASPARAMRNASILLAERIRKQH